MVMYGKNPKGELRDAEGHHNEWLTVEELVAKDKVFESIAEIVEFAKDGTRSLLEQNYYYEPAEY